MSSKDFVLFVTLSAVIFLFTSCAHQPPPDAYDPPGFWSGLLHGFIILFSLIGSLFTDVRIYAFPNSGGWYDFGFLLGAALFFGGGGSSTRQYIDKDETNHEE
jgi:hypothetical protein